MKRLRLPALLLAAALIVAACGSGTGSVRGGGPSVGRGKQLFAATCVTCHGLDGKGVPSLGKDLTTSQFVRDQTDDELATFLINGRASTDPLNTTGIAMPPRAGNPALTDADLEDIVAYLRSIQVGGGSAHTIGGSTTSTVAETTTSR